MLLRMLSHLNSSLVIGLSSGVCSTSVSFPFCLDLVLVPFWQVHLYCYNKLFLSFDDLNVIWLIVNNYVSSRTFSKHGKKQNVSNFPLKLTYMK